MRILLYVLFISLFCSCASLKIASNRNASNTPSIGIESNFDSEISDVNKDSVEMVIGRVMDKFNNGKHAFSVHNKKLREKDYITLDFSKAKVASNANVALGYSVSSIGLIASPVLVFILSEQSFILFFWYFPANKIHYLFTLSPNLADERGGSVNRKIETGALFRSKRKRLEVTLQKFEKVLYQSLLDIESQLKNK